MNKMTRWLIGAVLLVAAIGLIVMRPLPFLFYHNLPFAAFFGRAVGCSGL